MMAVIKFDKEKALASKKITAGYEDGMSADASGNGQREYFIHEGHVLLPDGVVTDVRIAERFRILRARLERRYFADSNMRVIALTSSVPAEGKSMIAVNLARAFGGNPRGKALLVDCDLRRPSTHLFFGLTPGPGLSDVLVGSLPIDTVIRSVEPGLDILTAGNPINDPHRAIEQPLLWDYLSKLKQVYRCIIIDTPPVLLCPEPINLTSLVDGTLMVVRAWRTDKALVKDAINVIGRDSLMGVIVNDSFESVNQYSYYRYYRYYGKSSGALKSFEPRSGSAHKSTSPRRRTGGALRRRLFGSVAGRS